MMGKPPWSGMKPSIGRSRASAFRDFFLERLRFSLKEHGRLRLPDRDVHGDQLGVIHPMEQQQVAAVVDDGHGDEPLVLRGLGLSRHRHAFGGFERQHSLGRQLPSRAHGVEGQQQRHDDSGNRFPESIPGVLCVPHAREW